MIKINHNFQKKNSRHIESRTQSPAEFLTNPVAHTHAGVAEQTGVHVATFGLWHVGRQPSSPHLENTSFCLVQAGVAKIYQFFSLNSRSLKI